MLCFDLPVWSCLRGSDLSRNALEGEHPLGATRTDKGPRDSPVTPPRPPHPVRPSRTLSLPHSPPSRRAVTVPCRTHAHSFRSPRLSPPSHTDEVTHHRERGKSAHPAAFFHASTTERRHVVPLSAAPRALTVTAHLPHGATVGAERLSARVCAQPLALRCVLRKFLSWSH